MNHCFAIFITRIAICIFAVSQTMLAPLIVLIGADFNLGVGGSGFLFTAYYISNIFFCLVTGKIIGLLGKRNAMAVGVISYAIATCAFAHTHIFWLACVIISAMGALATFIEAVGMDIVDALSVDAAASNLAVTHGFAGFGAVAGVVYVGFMLRAGFDWRWIYTVLSMAVAVVAICFCVTKFPRMPANPATGGIKELTGFLKNKSLYPTFLTLFLYVGAEGGITGWMATYMTDKLSYSSFVASLATGMIWLFVTMGRMVCSRLVIRYSVRRLVLTLDTICMLSILCAVFLPSVITFWIALAGIGIGLSGMWPLTASTALTSDQNGGTIMSLILFSGYFGSSIIPYIIGQVGEHFGMTNAILSCIFFFLLLGGSMGWLVPRRLSEPNKR